MKISPKNPKKSKILRFTYYFISVLVLITVLTSEILPKKLCSPSGIRIGTEFTYPGFNVIVSWNKVERYTDSTMVYDEIFYYYVFRCSVNDNRWELAGRISSGDTLEFVEGFSSARQAYLNPVYYRVYAVRDGWNEYYDNSWSRSSMIVDTSLDRNIIAIDESQQVAVFIPKEINSILYKENNRYNDDLEVTINKNSGNSWDIKIFTASNLEEVTRDFFFEKALGRVIINANMQYKTKTHIRSFSDVKISSDYDPLNDKKESIFWFNGLEWMSVATEDSGGFYSAQTKRLGKFKVMASGTSNSKFELIKVYPTIFTPGGISPFNQVEFIIDNKSAYTITGKIFDLSGAHIADMGKGMTDNSLSWDGETVNDDKASSGIYLYKISGNNGDRITGTIVLAR